MMLERGVLYKTNNAGPSTAPWGYTERQRSPRRSEAINRDILRTFTQKSLLSTMCYRNMSLLFLLLLLVMTPTMTQAKKVRMCYFTNWAQYRPNQGRFVPANIDPFVCTHILYAFAYIDADNLSLKQVEWNDAQLYREIIALKEENPELKVILGVGGYTHGTGPFETVAGSEENTNTFVGNAIAFLRNNKFDGMDVDWEYPTSSTKSHFQRFMRMLGKGFREESETSAQDRLELTMAVSGNAATVASSYGPAQFIDYVDYVLLMAYDLWGPWSATLGHQSPLYAFVPGHWEQGQFYMDKLVKEWEKHSTPKDKLVLGMATYGRSGILNSAAQHNPGDPWSKTVGPVRPFTSTPGFFAYYEVCTALNDQSWNKEYPEESAAPYAWNSASLEYICYDDPHSFKDKASYIVDNNLAGAMFWTIDFDDFSGQFCNAGRYPLLNQVKNVFEASTGPVPTQSPTTTTNPKPTTTPQPATNKPTTPKRATTTIATTQPPATASPGGCPPFTCPSAFGYFSDPGNCSLFYQCAHWIAHHMRCTPGLHFDPSMKACDYPDVVLCETVC